MEKHELECSDFDLWKDVQRAESQYAHARMKFFEKAKNPLEPLRKALVEGGPNPGGVLRYIECLDDQSVLELLPELIIAASRFQSCSHEAREAILKLPREQVLSNARPIVDQILSTGTEEEFLQLAALLKQLDVSMLKDLLDRASNHENPDVREVVEVLRK